MTWESQNRIKYVVADYLSTNIAFLLFNIFRYHELQVADLGFYSIGQFLLSPVLVASQIIFPVAMLGIYWLSGAYNNVSLRSRASELATTVMTAFAGTLLLFFVVLINDLTNDRPRDYSLFFGLFGLMFVLVYVPRLAITLSIQRKIRRGEIVYNTLVVGPGGIPQLFVEQLRKINPNMGLRPVALADCDNSSADRITGSALPMYNLTDVEDVCRQHDIKRVIVIPHIDGWNRTFDVLNGLFALDIPVYVAADRLPPFMFNAQLINLQSQPFIDVSSTHLPSATLNMKRAFDVAVAAMMLLLSAVPMAIIAVAVRLDSRGPVIYSQRRVGLHKNSFNIYKLRTMHVDAESDGHPALSFDGDSRVTRVGRFLRKYRLDELPQFVNVLRGDMSIVGPRPERQYYIDEILKREPSYTLVHRVRPGITSLGMVKYGYASTIEDMLQRSRYDMFYLENISIVTDLKIILHTFRTVFSGEGV